VGKAWHKAILNTFNLLAFEHSSLVSIAGKHTQAVNDIGSSNDKKYSMKSCNSALCDVFIAHFAIHTQCYIFLS